MNYHAKEKIRRKLKHMLLRETEAKRENTTQWMPLTPRGTGEGKGKWPPRVQGSEEA